MASTAQLVPARRNPLGALARGLSTRRGSGLSRRERSALIHQAARWGKRWGRNDDAAGRLTTETHYLTATDTTPAKAITYGYNDLHQLSSYADGTTTRKSRWCRTCPLAGKPGSAASRAV